MQNVLTLLEKLAATPQLQLDAEAINALLDQQTLAPALREAILTGDHASIVDALGGRSTMICAVFPAEPEKEPTPGDEPGDSPDDAPDQPADDGKSVRLH